MKMKQSIDVKRIRDIANEYFSCFEKATRDDKTEYWRVADLKGKNAKALKQELTSLCYEAHGDMFPDDHRYAFIVEALAAIIACEGELEEIQIEPDVYNSDLLTWISSRLDRAAYVNDAVKEYGLGTDFDLFKALAYGQEREKQEVLYEVEDFIKDKLEK